MWYFTSVCLTLCNPVDSGLPGRPLCLCDSPGKNTGVGCMPSSKGPSQPRDWTPSIMSPAMAGGFFTTGKPFVMDIIYVWTQAWQCEHPIQNTCYLWGHKRTELVIGTTESLSSVYKGLLLKWMKNKKIEVNMAKRLSFDKAESYIVLLSIHICTFL